MVTTNDIKNAKQTCYSIYQDLQAILAGQILWFRQGKLCSAKYKFVVNFYILTGAIMCVALVNRFETDYVTSDGKLIQEWEDNLLKIAIAYIKSKSNGFSN